MTYLGNYNTGDNVVILKSILFKIESACFWSQGVSNNFSKRQTDGNTSLGRRKTVRATVSVFVRTCVYEYVGMSPNTACSPGC